GSAVVAWQKGSDLSAKAITRAGTGPFTAPAKVGPAAPIGPIDPIVRGLGEFTAGALVSGSINAGDDQGLNHAIRAPGAGGGRAVVTIYGYRSDAGIQGGGVRIATMPLAGGVPVTATLGDPMRENTSQVPVVLAGGAPAVAWADGASELAKGDGRLRLAVEG